MTQPLGMLNRGATGKASGLTGTGYKQVSVPTMNRASSDLHSRLLAAAAPGAEKGAGFLSDMAQGGPESYAAFEKPAMRDFGALTGQMASRFSGMGGAGARKSSGFQNTMGEQAASLSENLAERRMGLQQQAIRDLLGMSHTLMQTPTEEHMLMPKQPKKQPFWKELLGSAVGGLAGGASTLAGGFGLSKMLGKREIGSSHGVEQYG